MTQVPPDKVEIRTSLGEVAVGVVAFAVLAFGVSFCSTLDTEAPADSGNPWLITGIVLVAGLFVLVRVLTNRAPRIILDATGVLWREGASKIYEALPWPEVLSATIEPGDEDEVKRLRLHLGPRPALESVASEHMRRWVDISIDAIDIHERRLRRLVNERAPHLFRGAARNAIDLTAT